ncbi:unnamed protein product [Schistocephalus solidus]|uniref:Uncharacterized protein n=1 Tax=Schistocephalus solidus TaxID=70667 RepID=A0A183TGT5_SCHSO|nr:unnamed protein product [Schistocephalus solidus]
MYVVRVDDVTSSFTHFHIRQMTGLDGGLNVGQVLWYVQGRLRLRQPPFRGILARCCGTSRGGSGRASHLRFLAPLVFLTLSLKMAQVGEEESAVAAAQGYYHLKLIHAQVTAPAPSFCGAYGGHRQTTTVEFSTQLSPVTNRSWALPSGHTPGNRHVRRTKPGESRWCCVCLHDRYVCFLPPFPLLPATPPSSALPFLSPLLPALSPLFFPAHSYLSPSCPLPSFPSFSPLHPRSKRSCGDGDMQS